MVDFDQLLEAFVEIVSPLRVFGIDPEVIALTASRMIRAISHLSGLLGESDRAPEPADSIRTRAPGIVD
ncbi:hypothetical protein ACH82I_15685 [Brevibacterium sp. GP-SGM9]|uniref:hypothetical protein n=1 Tax=Brevibacterium sp. GP-SGM9 TaxID=3376990 RepID=UPI0039A5533E